MVWGNEPRNPEELRCSDLPGNGFHSLQQEQVERVDFQFGAKEFSSQPYLLVATTGSDKYIATRNKGITTSSFLLLVAMPLLLVLASSSAK